MPFPVTCPCRRSPPAIFVSSKRPVTARTKAFTATLAVQSYGSSDFSAARLSHFVVQAMLDADTLPEIVSCDLVTEYNFPDTTRKRPRYQAVFSITHY